MLWFVIRPISKASSVTPDFFYVFNPILSFSTCSQSFKKICPWELVGANVLNFSFMRLYFKNGTVNFFLLWNFNKLDETKLLAKFKKIQYTRFTATLNFRKLKVALNPMCRLCLNFAKSYILTCLSKFCNKKKFHRAVY